MELTVAALKAVNAHLGHPHRFWNPKMKEYILETRRLEVNGRVRRVDILNLQQSLVKIKELAVYLQRVARVEHARILFVGTNFSAKWVIKDVATRSGNYYVTERWLGGTLTNFRTVKSRINRLFEIRRNIDIGQFDLLTKGEQMALKKEQAELEKLFAGIERMKELPYCLFVVNPVVERKAVLEARKLNIPVIGLCDSDGDPTLLEVFAPLNDNFYKPIELVMNYLITCYAQAKKIELAPPTPKPEAEINRDLRLRTRRNIAKKIQSATSRRRFAGQWPVSQQAPTITSQNYRALIAAGRATPTAVQAERWLKPGLAQRVFDYQSASEEYFQSGFRRRFDVEPEVKPAVSTGESKPDK